MKVKIDILCGLFGAIKSAVESFLLMLFVRGERILCGVLRWGRVFCDDVDWFRAFYEVLHGV